MLLLVIDIADPAWEDKRAEVLSVLEELGASAVPRIEVHNKIDLTEDPQLDASLAPVFPRRFGFPRRRGLALSSSTTRWRRN